MTGILIDAKVDRIQLPGNLRYQNLIKQQEERCKKLGCADSIHKFGLSQSPFNLPEKIRNALAENSDKGKYTDTEGIFELREAVAGYYKNRFGLDIDPSRVIIGSGVKGLVFAVFTLIAGSVLVPSPGWLGYLPQLRILNMPYYRMYTHYSQGYKIKAPILAAQLRGLVNTQHLLVLNNPATPTGALYTIPELMQIADVCRKYRTLVLADEIYGDLTYDPDKFVSMATIYPEGTFTIQSLSATYSAGGFRLGTCLMPEGIEQRVTDDFTRILATLYTCAPHPIQYAAITAYTKNPDMEEYLMAVRKIHKIMTSRLAARCGEIEGVRVSNPEGGFTFMADLNQLAGQLKAAGIITSNDLAPAILSHPYHVAALTGEAMMASYDAYYIRFVATDYDGEAALIDYRLNTPKTEDEERAFFELHGTKMIKGMESFQKWIKDLMAGKIKVESTSEYRD